MMLLHRDGKGRLHICGDVQKKINKLASSLVFQSWSMCHSNTFSFCCHCYHHVKRTTTNSLESSKQKNFPFTFPQTPQKIKERLHPYNLFLLFQK